MVWRILSVLGYLLFAPILGGLLDGLERKVSARMQRRVGPPLLQPFYDVKKLLDKQHIAVTDSQTLFLLTWMFLMIFTGCMLFSGTDILMCFFMLSTAGIFLYFMACVTNSPYSQIGAQRELIQEMSCEPAILLTSLGFYLVTGSFEGAQIIQSPKMSLLYMPGFFLAYVFILTIKLRKSPFDTSTSHHAHQELVKGVTTEIGSVNLALFQITEWYEMIFLLGVLALFLLNSSPLGVVLALIVIAVVWFAEILIDNTNARMKWGNMLMLSWSVTLVLAGVNLIILFLVL